ncbi:pilus assembly protein [Agromyces protaetiae]|uniref:Pilus assembly protein n=1 Tax=Agromyces protaetiae TaxID=2509455 RepID=A0A4P6FI67_9MICO|nr:TadE/TadG family type IV pilus assembly protein [Agromyces protaetiae]QAY73657.1 pilus assembly protein [Agromyces protaetiae]
MVAALLTTLVLAVLQFALALHVRTTLLDAAAEGARYAALAGTTDAEGAQRTVELVSTALSPGYASDVHATRTEVGGVPVVAVTVRAALPVFGLIGIDGGLEVTGHAAIEALD